MQLLHNWNQLHMRTAFEDHPVCVRLVGQAVAKPCWLLLRSLAAPAAAPPLPTGQLTCCSTHPWASHHAAPKQGFENRRHLLRLHLTHADARPLDPDVFGPGEPGNRLGVYAGGGM